GGGVRGRPRADGQWRAGRVDAPDDAGATAAAVLARVVPGAEVQRADAIEPGADGRSVEALFIVQVRPGRSAGAAHRADPLADPHRLADADRLDREMRVARGEATAVRDLDP